MAFWMTKVPGGEFAMGEAPDEAEARLMIAREQGRASVTFNRRSGRYRWTVVVEEGKTSHGWAETEAEGWRFVKEVVNRPFRGTHHRKPRGLWTLPPTSDQETGVARDNSWRRRRRPAMMPAWTRSRSSSPTASGRRCASATSS